MIGVELMIEIRYLDRQGLSKSQIARRLGLSRTTVRKYLDNPGLDERKRVKRSSILGPDKPYLQYRLEQWPELTAARLHREMQTLSCPVTGTG